VQPHAFKQAVEQVEVNSADELTVFLRESVERAVRQRDLSASLVGRAYLYGLMARGRAGVDRAIQILSDEIARTMSLLGVRALDELESGHVTQLRRIAPIENV
jgi:hypothetical protein